jgi:uncharacterized phiE125 gp8 family phage protein
MTLSLVTAPTELPISIHEMKMHLRVDHDMEDALIDSMIQAAVDVWEGETGRQVMRAEYDLFLPAFPDSGPIRIPRPPLFEVVSVEYVATEGAAPVLWDAAEYMVTAPQGSQSLEGTIYPRSGTFPATAGDHEGTVRIRFRAGYPQDHVPAAVKLRLMLLVSDLYATRESQVVGTITAENRTVELLIRPFRLPVMA